MPITAWVILLLVVVLVPILLIRWCSGSSGADDFMQLSISQLLR
jgi:hypothetical protein